MTIGVLTIEILIPDSQSLKDKRHVIQSMIKKMKNQFNVAVAEVENQDLLQRSTLAVVSVNSSQQELNRTMDYVVNWVEKEYDIEIIRFGVEYR
ncbi:MAG: DUF503 domain-containing protein [Caldisericia bacterium]|nr:DUF503 domain-containing protein [Caldisericia bacterium]